MKRLATTLLLTCTFASASAAPGRSEINTEALATANAYASAIACAVSDITPTDIVALRPYTSMEDRHDAEYLVFWEGDIGCLGGSATSTFNVSSIMIATGDSYLVDLDKSSPAVGVQAGRGAKLIGHTGEKIFMETMEYADGDANCCPSITRRIAITRDRDGNWNESD